MKNILIELHDVVLLSECKRWLAKRQEKETFFLVKNTKEAINIMQFYPINFFLIELDQNTSKSDSLESLAALSFYQPSLKIGILTSNDLSREDKEKFEEITSFCIIDCFSKLKDFIEFISLLDIAESQSKIISQVLVYDFFKLIEITQKTCLLSIETERKTKKGVVYFEQGVLYDAAYAGIKSEAAIIEMLTWENVKIYFNNINSKKFRKQINLDLKQLLIEATQIKTQNEINIFDPSVAEQHEEIIDSLPIMDIEDQEESKINPLESLEEQVINLLPVIAPTQDKSASTKTISQNKKITAYIDNKTLEEILKPLQDINDDYLASAIFDMTGDVLMKHNTSNYEIENIAKDIVGLIEIAINTTDTIKLGKSNAIQMNCNEGILEAVWDLDDGFIIATLLKSTTKHTGLTKMLLAKISNTIHNQIN